MGAGHPAFRDVGRREEGREAEAPNWSSELLSFMFPKMCLSTSELSEVSESSLERELFESQWDSLSCVSLVASEVARGVAAFGANQEAGRMARGEVAGVEVVSVCFWFWDSSRAGVPGLGMAGAASGSGDLGSVVFRRWRWPRYIGTRGQHLSGGAACTEVVVSANLWSADSGANLWSADSRYDRLWGSQGLSASDDRGVRAGARRSRPGVRVPLRSARRREPRPVRVQAGRSHRFGAVLPAAWILGWMG